MREWIPVPGTTKARLVDVALRAFAEHGLEGAGVTAIADAAGVTVGSLYHHFGSKQGLYDLVRGDVERRLLDRMEGAWSATPSLAAAIGVGYDYLVRSGFTGLLAEERAGDPVEGFLAERTADAPARLLAAAWRAAISTHDPATRAALMELVGSRDQLR